MKRATRILRAGAWPAESAIDEITLDYDHRHRRRLRFTTTDNMEILLDLAEAIHIRDGDALALEGGGYISVRSANEELLNITAQDAHTLTRLAWHLGNRHLAVQFGPGVLCILHDHVIAAMVGQLGGTATMVKAPFDPESGAYAHE